jgi:hypothetical protein
MAIHNGWAALEKAMYLLAILQRNAVNILQNIPAGATYEDTVRAQMGHYAHHQQAAAHKSKPDKLNTKLLQEFTAAINRLAYWVPVRLSGLHPEGNNLCVH